MDTEMEEVKRDIRKVEQQIDDAEGQLTKAVTEADVAYWREKEKQLRKKELQLRKEEDQLWEKELLLREKELLLLKAHSSEGEPSSKKPRGSPEIQVKKLVGLLNEGINARKDSYCSMRRNTAVQLCEMVDERGAVLIRAPPGSSKTSLLQLVALVNTPDIFENVYYISLAALSGSERTFESLWADWHPGVTLEEIRSPPKGEDKKTNRRPNLILVDEGQAAFDMNLTLWGTLKSVMGGRKEHLRMIVVSSWGSAIVSDGGRMVPTPVQFQEYAIVTLWPTNGSLSLQFTLIEAMEIGDKWCQMVLGVGDSPMSFDDLRDYIFTLTGRQPGLLSHILDWLRFQGLPNIPADSQKQKARSLLQSASFYASLSSLRSLMSLIKALRRGGNPNAEPMRGVVRLLLREEPLRRSSLSGLAGEAADKAVKWGQVIEEQGILSIPSQLHRLFLCRELYCSADASVASIRKEGFSSFVRRVIERLEPNRLQLSESRSVDNSVYERKFKNEFYKAACTIISKDAVLSPDVGPLYGVRGFLDFLLSPLGWGFKLLRDGSNLEEDAERFRPSGAYVKLIQDKVVVQYVILDFRMKPLVEAVQSDLIFHVVFSHGFKTATLHTFGSEPEILHVGLNCTPGACSAMVSKMQLFTPLGVGKRYCM